MTFPNGLKRICDICCYMVFATLIATPLGSYDLIATLPVFAIVAFLAAFLAPRGRIKYISLTPLPLIFLIVPLTIVNLVVFTLAILYMIWAIPKQNESVAGFNYEAVFNGFLKVFGVILLLRFGVFAPLFDGAPFPTDTLFFAAAFLLLATIFTRMIRHDENILNQIGFKLINMISVIGVVLGIFLVTNRTFLEITTTIWFFIARYLIYLLLLIAYPIARLLSLLLTEFDPEAMLLMGGLNFIDDYGIEYYEADSQPIWPLIIAVIVVGIVMIIGLPLLFKLIKALLSKVLGIRDDEDIEDEFIPLDDKDKKKRRFRRRENQIRELYRDFLKLIKKNDIDISLHLTSKELEIQVATTFNTETSSALRNEYIQVRYKENDFTKDDVKRMKELYKNVKEEIETFSN